MLIGSRSKGLLGAKKSERLEPPGNSDCAPAKGNNASPSTAAVGSATSAIRRRLTLVCGARELRTVERESLERMNMSSLLMCRYYFDVLSLEKWTYPTHALPKNVCDKGIRTNNDVSPTLQKCHDVAEVSGATNRGTRS